MVVWGGNNVLLHLYILFPHVYNIFPHVYNIFPRLLRHDITLQNSHIHMYNVYMYNIKHTINKVRYATSTLPHMHAPTQPTLSPPPNPHTPHLKGPSTVNIHMEMPLCSPIVIGHVCQWGHAHIGAAHGYCDTTTCNCVVCVLCACVCVHMLCMFCVCCFLINITSCTLHTHNIIKHHIPPLLPFTTKHTHPHPHPHPHNIPISIAHATSSSCTSIIPHPSLNNPSTFALIPCTACALL